LVAGMVSTGGLNHDFDTSSSDSRLRDSMGVVRFRLASSRARLASGDRSGWSTGVCDP